MKENFQDWRIIKEELIPHSKLNERRALTKQVNKNGAIKYVKVTESSHTIEEVGVRFLNGISIQGDGHVVEMQEINKVELTEQNMFLVTGMLYMKYLEWYWDKKSTK